MNTPGSTAIPESPAEEAWLYYLAAAAVLSSLVIAVLGMPDLLTSGPRRFSLLLLSLPFILGAGVIALKHRLRDIKPGAIDTALLVAMTYLMIRNIRLVSIEYAVYGISLFYLSSLVVQQQRFLKAIIFTFVSLAAIASLLGAAELFLLQDNLASLFISNPDSGTVFHRIGSTLLHPVVFGAFLAMALPLCGFLGIFGTTRKARILGLSSTALGLLAFLFTFSKGGWLVMILMGCVFGLFFIKNRNWPRLLLVAGLVIIVILLPVLLLWQPVTHQTMIRLKSSFVSRRLTWECSIRAAEQNLIFGTGLRMGPSALPALDENIRKFNETHPNLMPVDNFYLSYSLEEGLAGFFPFLLFLILLLMRGAKSLFERGANRALLIAIFASIVGILLDALTFEMFSWWSIYVCFWSMAGMLYGLTMPGYNRPVFHCKPGVRNRGLAQAPAGSDRLCVDQNL
ncbi:MAG: O-antigen ligase family protein [Thermoleophilia bacterium]